MSRREDRLLHYCESFIFEVCIQSKKKCSGSETIANEGRHFTSYINILNICDIRRNTNTKFSLPLSFPLTSKDICSASSDRVSSVPLVPFNERARLIFLIPEQNYSSKSYIV